MARSRGKVAIELAQPVRGDSGGVTGHLFGSPAVVVMVVDLREEEEREVLRQGLACSGFLGAGGQVGGAEERGCGVVTWGVWTAVSRSELMLPGVGGGIGQSTIAVDGWDWVEIVIDRQDDGWMDGRAEVLNLRCRVCLCVFSVKH